MVLQHYNLRLAAPDAVIKLKTALKVRPAEGIRMLIQRRETTLIPPDCHKSEEITQHAQTGKCPFHMA